MHKAPQHFTKKMPACIIIGDSALIKDKDWLEDQWLLSPYLTNWADSLVY